MAELKTEKDEVFDEAKEKHGVELDRRMKLSDMKDHLERMEKEKDNPRVKSTAIRKPKTVRNIHTGNEFSYNELFQSNPDLEVIEWETDDGND